MPSDNPFPESPEKQYLRRLHLLTLSERRNALKRPLTYMGLPSAEMFDVRLWKRLLGEIVAIERDPAVADTMYRTAEYLGVREKTIIIEDSLTGFSDWLVLDARRVESSIMHLSAAEQLKIHRCRSLRYDLVNLDLCGGFLYPKRGERTSDNLVLLQNLVAFQSQHRTPFLLLLTFNLRDTGRDDYETFIDETLGGAASHGWDTTELLKFYNTESGSSSQPLNLRRLRFCVPAYLHRVAYQSFQVRSLGAWYYKRFYHTALSFELRDTKGVLGVPWPPPDEIKELLHAPMTRLRATAHGVVSKEPLPAPIVEDALPNTS